MIKLRPNCLLTRYPVCFLHGRKTLLSFLNYWNGVPRYLRAHGYETFELAAPWRGSSQSRILFWTEQFSLLRLRYDKIHIVAHAEAALEITDLLNSNRDDLRFIESVTVVGASGLTNLPDKESKKPLICELEGPSKIGPRHPLVKMAIGSKLHKGFRPSKFLDHCIFLAEHDLKTSQ